MNDAGREHWRVADFFVARTPYLPLDSLLGLGDGLEAADGDDDPQAVERDRVRVRDRLRDLVDRRDVREALYLSSPSLAGRIEGWRRGAADRRVQRAERSLLCYLSRMAARPTPFGLFAGWSIGRSGGPATRLHLAAQTAYRRRSSLDCGYLGALSESLQHDPSLRPNLKWVPNPTLYEAAHRLRYVKSGDAGHCLVVVDPDQVLRRVLDRAATGLNEDELTAVVRAAAPDADPQEAREFVTELIMQQVVVCDLTPAVTGPDPLDGLIDQLTAVAPNPIAATLGHVRGLLRAIDTQPPGADPSRYGQIAAALHALPVSVDPARLIRTDLIKPARAVLGDDVVAEISRGVHLLARISGGRRDPLDHFRAAFRQRYGDREVPLCEALDEECGIGFPGAIAPGAAAEPLLGGLRFPPARQRQRAVPGRRGELLARWLADAVRDDAPEIVLGPEEVAALEAADDEPGRLPDAFSVLATVLAGGPEAIAAGRYRICLSGVAGPSGSSLLGRFCAGDQELTERVRAHLRAEEALRPEAVFAEIVHLPQPRLGNVLARPLLRDHEIPYLGRSGAPGDAQIAVTDLMVSVVGNRVTLRSRRLNREIIPRLTAAHNFNGSRNLGLYRFLCVLQGQDTLSGLSFSLGPLVDAPYFPRITMGRLVISRARWKLGSQELRTLAGAPSATRFATMRTIRRRLRLPRWVAVCDGDNLLPVDLGSPLFVDAVAEMLRGRTSVLLVELFHGPDDVLATGPEGRFVHELVVPFVRTAPAPAFAAHPAVRPRTPRSVARRFPPGSEWLYTKHYTGTSGADAVLRHVVQPLVAQALSSGAADGWFFVRYGDPDWHIRLRLHGDSAALLSDVLPALLAGCEPFLSSGLIWRVQLDTYEREIERYGGPAGILLAEQIFGIDSDTVLDVLHSLDGDTGADTRWRQALVGTDRLLSDLEMDTPVKHALVSAARDRFSREFRVDLRLRRQLGERFRRERGSLERALRSAGHGAHERYAARSAAWRPIIADLRAAVPGDRLPAVAGSLLHMHANRMLCTAARQQELVIYDFLTRLYASELARRR